MSREGTSIEEGCLVAGLMTRKLISIRCDPPLPGNPPTPRRQVLSRTVVNIMQNIQRCKRLEGSGRREADTSRVFAWRCKKGHAKIYCLREKEKEKKRGAWVHRIRTEKTLLLINQPGWTPIIAIVRWASPQIGVVVTAYVHACVRVCVSSGTYPTRIRVSVTSLLTQGCSEIRCLKLSRERLSSR